MKYFLKALTTNNRDLKTSVVFSLMEVQTDKMYLFSCPDGFQRVANLQKMKFQKVNYVFVPSLSPDHFAGFPGFFLSAREACNFVDFKEKFQITMIGPTHLSSTMEKSVSFTGDYHHNLMISEIPDDLNSHKIEESKDLNDDVFVFVPDT